MQEHSTAHSLALPSRVLAHKLAALFLFIATIALIIVAKNNDRFNHTIRGIMSDGIAPIMHTLSRPMDTAAELGTSMKTWLTVHEENKQLRQEVSRLKQWHMAALQLEHENAALRELMKYTPPPSTHYISAQIISDHSGPYHQSALINAGISDGIQTGSAIVNDDGLVGKVVEAGQHSARVLLLTDINARVPVILEDTGERSILAGDNSDMPRLTYLSAEKAPKHATRVITSGDGGVFPKGIAVGTIARTDADGSLRVRPFVDWGTLNYIRAIDFSITPPDETAPGK